MARSNAVLALVFAAVLAGCPKGGGDAAPDAAPGANADAGLDGAAGEIVEDDEVRAVYPADAGPPDPLVRKLCGALHDLPEARRAACCSANASVVLTSECARTMTAAIAFKAVTLAAADVDACEQAMQKAYEGCDWVGPFAPEVPAACLGIVKGLLAATKRCRSSLECAADMRCHGVGPTTTGRCAPPSAAGEKCGGSADTLAGYARQNDLDTRHPECTGWCERTKCADRVALGGACSLGAACGDGKLCVAGKCAAAAPAKIGEACPGEACEKGALCIQGKCVAKKPAGAACAADFECLGGCLKGDAGAKGVCGKKCGAR
jgi:hypothetical protein